MAVLRNIVHTLQNLSTVEMITLPAIAANQQIHPSNVPFAKETIQ